MENKKAKESKRRWDKAYDALRREKEDLVNDFEKILLSESESGLSASLDSSEPTKREEIMSSFVSKKLAAMDDKKWRLDVAGSSIEVREQVDRLLKTILVAKDFISSVASMDPIHAGLPWAGVCMLLSVGIFILHATRPTLIDMTGSS